MFQNFFSRSSFQNSMNNSMVSSKEHLAGSNKNLSASLSGLSFNILDPMKLMSMREDARARFISSQVMKRSLYESVVSPSNRLAGKRRYSAAVTTKRRPQSYYDSRQERDGTDLAKSGNSSVCCSKELSERWRDVQSLPVSPCQSPRASKRFCGSLASDSRDQSSEFLTVKGGLTGSRRSMNLSRTNLLLTSRKNNAGSGLASILRPPCPKFVSATALQFETGDGSQKTSQTNSSDSINNTSSNNELDSEHGSLKLKRSSRTAWNEDGLFSDMVHSRLEPISSGSSIAPSVTAADERQSLLSLLAANIEDDDENGGGRGRCEFLKPKDIPEEEMDD